MGNYQSDQKNTRFFGLKLSRNTDKDLIEHLEQQDNKQTYIKGLIRNDITKEERKMKISALNTSEQKVRVEIDPNGQRHIMVAGEEISNIDRTDLQLSRQIDNALDDLYDLPIYENGMIHTGKTKTVWVWQEATLVTKT